MAMRLQRSKKSRSWSKDRRKKHAGGARSSSRAPIYAFCCGSVLLTVLWGMLQRFGVPGPWARPTHHDSSYQDRVRSLRRKRDDLQKQNLALDAKLAVHRGTPRTFYPGPDLGGGVVYQPAGVTVEKDGHFILGLSDEEFRSTPVDEMMSPYDTHKCDESFGNGLVDRWRNTGRECCVGDVADHSSSVRCHLMHQADHRGSGDNLVQMKNVQVDMSYFRDAGVAQGVMAAYKRSKHSEQAYVHFRKGAIKGTCAPDSQSWKENNFPGWNADWTTKAFQSVEGMQCDEWVDHPVLVVQRDTFANLFHDSEDFVNTFLAMAILRKSPGDTQVLLTDLYPRGPFWPMWDKVFGAGLPTLTAWEAGRRYGEKKTCFRDLTVGIYGPAAPTTLARMVTSCFHTALVRAYSDFVIRGLGLQGHTRYTSPPSKKVVVTWMARRSSVQWPERAYCSEDGKDSFFTCEYFMHLDKRDLQRKVRNEAEVVASLKTLENKEFGNGAEVEVRDVDYNLLSFEEQIKADLETDVMIGPHGAGLYHIIFTPDRASLIELQIDQTTQRKHFNNLARWSGHGYSSRGGPNPVPADATKRMVEEVIARMDLTKH